MNFYTSREVTRLKEGEAITWPLEGYTDYNFTFGINPKWEHGAEWFYVSILVQLKVFWFN